MAPDIRALLVDDEPDMRMVMRMVIEADDIGVSVCGEAQDGEEAVAAAENLRPNVVVIDVRMPHLDGLAAAARILAAHPGQRIILCTAYFDRELNRQATEMGIRACIPKTEIVDITTVIKRVAEAA